MSSLDLYNDVSIRCSKEVTNSYSTSFSLGIKLFHESVRDPIYSIYGFVRVADEIVDTFHSYDKKGLFDNFRDSVIRDFDFGISANPIINAYLKVCDIYNIPFEYTIAFLDSMAMDLYEVEFDRSSYDKYIYGSAEVIGLMCLKIFCHKSTDQFENLKPYAQKLGSAFQKINFLRDIQSDQLERGRIYFPNLKSIHNLNEFKQEIENEIQEEFDNALIGVKLLPENARLGVYVAYRYYSSLLKKIRNSEAEKVQSSRVRITDLKKLTIYTMCLAKYKLNIL